MGRSRVELRDRFVAQLQALQAAGSNASRGVLGTGQYLSYQPDPGAWNGNPLDLAGINLAFSRDENTADFVSAISSLEDAGVVGDLAISSLQGDYLACMERSYRASNMPYVRRMVHAAARRRAHGDVRGVFGRGVIGYLENMLKQTKIRGTTA